MIAVSYLRDIYFSKNLNRVTLQQARITETKFNDSWPDFVTDFLATATYPKPSSSKYECYGWTPTIFTEGENKKGEWGHWRLGQHGGDELSLFILDMDNQFPDRTMITIDQLEAFLRHLGLSFVLYTSFTHKPERHKVRVITPVTRHLTPDEAFKVFTWFNAALDFQLDGAIFDKGDFLYGPPLESDVRTELSGQPLDVDHYLTLADGLDDEAKTFVARGGGDGERYDPTPEQIAQAIKMAAITEPSDQDVSINNPKFFNPKWMELLADQYQGGSRSRTIRGLIAKAWVKSQGTLTKGDLWTLYHQLDAHYGGYCVRTYGRSATDRDITSAMEAVGSPMVAPGADDEAKTARLMKRLGRKN